ncbi:MAG: hypothetical protein Ct9H90mP27_0220 [Gammaproteobacteria bacterium]|nr:MAG: hypothetical protein Ct9H90mP27_0220 [Gammaproteobacteria bacterium]
MASVSVLFFASLRDEVGESEVELDVEDLDDLRMQLTDRFGVSTVASLFEDNVRIAVNKDVIEGGYDFRGGEEFAFLPPVTGG